VICVKIPYYWYDYITPLYPSSIVKKQIDIVIKRHIVQKIKRIKTVCHAAVKRAAKNRIFYAYRNTKKPICAMARLKRKKKGIIIFNFSFFVCACVCNKVAHYYAVKRHYCMRVDTEKCVWIKFNMWDMHKSARKRKERRKKRTKAGRGGTVRWGHSSPQETVCVGGYIPLLALRCA